MPLQNNEFVLVESGCMTFSNEAISAFIAATHGVDQNILVHFDICNKTYKLQVIKF